MLCCALLPGLAVIQQEFEGQDELKQCLHKFLVSYVNKLAEFIPAYAAKDLVQGRSFRRYRFINIFRANLSILTVIIINSLKL